MRQKADAENLQRPSIVGVSSEPEIVLMSVGLEHGDMKSNGIARPEQRCEANCRLAGRSQPLNGRQRITKSRARSTDNEPCTVC